MPNVFVPITSSTSISSSLTLPNGIYYPISFYELCNDTIELKTLNYSIIFYDIDNDKLLLNNIKEIKNNKLIFSCDLFGNKIEPYETIMKLISKEQKFQIKIEINNLEDKILSIYYSNVQFIKIKNNFKFKDNSCNFSNLIVKFKYDKVLYENYKLSEKELRVEKLKKILDK